VVGGWWLVAPGSRQRQQKNEEKKTTGGRRFATGTRLLASTNLAIALAEIVGFISGPSTRRVASPSGNSVPTRRKDYDATKNNMPLMAVKIPSIPGHALKGIADQSAANRARTNCTARSVTFQSCTSVLAPYLIGRNVPSTMS
jgi:hypothetical protein